MSSTSKQPSPRDYLTGAIRWPPPHRHWPQPRDLTTQLAIAVYNNAMPGISTVQAFSLDGNTGPVTLLSLQSGELSGITPGDQYFYVQSPFNLYGPQLMPLEVAQPGSGGGILTPSFTLNSIVYAAGAIYVQGVFQDQVGLMCFDAATGAPMGAAAGNPMLVPGYASANCGMGLFNDGSGDMAIVLPSLEGLVAFLIQQGGAPVSPPTVLGPYPYSVLQGLPPDVSILGPRMGPDGNLYFLYVTEPYDAGMGIFTVSPSDVRAVLETGATSVNVTIFQPTTSQLQLTGGFCVGGTAEEPFVYVTTYGWASETQAIWGVVQAHGDGEILPCIVDQPGIAWGVCIYSYSS